MSKSEQFQGSNSLHAKRVHQGAFYMGTITFVACCVITIPCFQVENVISLYQWLLRVYSCLLFLAEIAEFYIFQHANVSQSLLLSLLSLIGNFLYFQGSFLYDSFNEGMLYMIASFFLSLSSELKVLFIIMDKGKKVFTSITEDRYQCYLQTCSGTASFLFLISSTLSLVMTDEYITKIVIAICNNIAGLLMLCAAYNLRRRYNMTRGYLRMEQMSEVLAFHH